jgi:hypothetical protein
MYCSTRYSVAHKFGAVHAKELNVYKYGYRQNNTKDLCQRITLSANQLHMTLLSQVDHRNLPAGDAAGRSKIKVTQRCSSSLNMILYVN